MTPATGSADSDLRARLTPPRNPLRMLVSPLGWRSVLYCFTSIVGGALALLAAILGILVLPLVTWATANVERARLVVLGLPRLAPLPRSRVRHPWDPRGFSDGNLAVWGITVLFALVDAVPGSILAVLVIGLALTLGRVLGEGAQPVEIGLVGGGLLVVLLVGLYVAWALAAAQATIVDLQLRPHSDLRQQVDDLTTSRRELVDVFATERRRIERDLHDGAQQHLVLLSMQLGEAEYALDQHRTEDARRAIGAAQASVEAAVTSLRETVRGIHPQLLTDRGLVAAVRELAARQPVPARVEVTGDGREPAEQLSAAVYYLVSEAFTNVTKHAGATRVTVRLALGNPVQVEVYDDGRGGARVRPGHGLSGQLERTRALGGACWLSSPPGGPTTLRAEFPNPG
ncbi:MAG: histidine kinase [Propionicimonas sp.]|uniref:sensor histidine kinase n=1 Tax=Propionicimonas sp. TaxID=1955623 RepID=UPI003D0FC465